VALSLVAGKVFLVEADPGRGAKSLHNRQEFLEKQDGFGKVPSHIHILGALPSEEKCYLGRYLMSVFVNKSGQLCPVTKVINFLRVSRMEAAHNTQTRRKRACQCSTKAEITNDKDGDDY
jgi:hypothetical protein